MATLFAVSAAIAAPLMFSQSSYAASTGPFEIINPTSGLCLTNPNFPSTGVQLVLEPCGAGNSQEWSMVTTINNIYQIANWGTDDCMDAPVNANFAAVDTFPCDGISNENWSPGVGGPPLRNQNIVSLVGGPGATHRCLDVSNGNIVPGGVVGLYRCFGGTDNVSQGWTTS